MTTPTTHAGTAQDLEVAFDRIRARLADPDFLANKGLGGEIGFYVFPYDAACEDELRARTAALVEESEKGQLPCRIVHRDLWDVFIKICEDYELLDDLPEHESSFGTSALEESIATVATPEEFVEAMDYEPHEPGRDVLLITGVGKVYPLVRAHSILENAQHVFDDIPVVLLYPGRYDRRQLHLFNAVNDGNYYRAFSQL